MSADAGAKFNDDLTQSPPLNLIQDIPVMIPSKYRDKLNHLADDYATWQATTDKVAPLWLFLGTASLWGVVASPGADPRIEISVAVIRVFSLAIVVSAFGNDALREAGLRERLPESGGFPAREKVLMNEVTDEQHYTPEIKDAILKEIKAHAKKREAAKTSVVAKASLAFFAVSSICFILDLFAIAARHRLPGH